MTAVFYTAAVIAVVATIFVITRRNLVHALLYLVVSLFAVAVVFYTLGAPFVAALEIVVYAGAIMMLFLFAVMLLNLRADEAARLPVRYWAGPGILAAVLLVELIYGLAAADQTLATGVVGPQVVSESLFGAYVLGVELASMLLLAALIGARHVAGRQDEMPRQAGLSEEDGDLEPRLAPATGPRDEPDAEVDDGPPPGQAGGPASPGEREPVTVGGDA
ncbi:MAG TPA: NADH-quinone oxidoreductase subunit J [Thermoleophilia bacterium]|nr:NADH-quinone oxidoreductase subunit J [Thermoleophilia bacterium]